MLKLTFDSSALLGAINIVLKAVPSRTTMPILNCILIDASGSRILLTANDTELGIQTAAAGEILTHGRIALDARLFSEIIRKLSGENMTVTIEADDDLNTVISCENATFRIQGMDAEEFTGIPFIEEKNYISLSQFTLREVIRQTIFSIAPNDSNKMMTGELFQIQDDTLKVVSLDGHRLSIRKVLLKDHYNDSKVIVPGKTLNEISKILEGDNEKEVLVYFSPSHIMFRFEDTTVVSRLIEGEYFRIDQMLSSDYETKITINRKEMLDNLDRALILVKENDKKPFILNITDGLMQMHLNSAMGTMNSSMLINKSGRDLMIGFNPKFLMDALRIIDDEEVDLYMMNPKSPCFIKDSAENYIYLVLPVNFTPASY